MNLGTWSAWASPVAQAIVINHHLPSQEPAVLVDAGVHGEGIVIPLPIKTIADRDVAPDERTQRVAGVA